MIESWIDNLAKVWRISDQKFGTVQSYLLIEKAEFPSSIDPATLATQPVAFTVPGIMKPEYSLGGPKIGFYEGVTEFHVAPDLDRARFPSLMPWYGKILQAAASNVTLSNTVEYFLIDKEAGIVGPRPVSYGGEAWHWGFIVSWVVKERPLSLTVSA